MNLHSVTRVHGARMAQLSDSTLFFRGYLTRAIASTHGSAARIPSR